MSKTIGVTFDLNEARERLKAAADVSRGDAVVLDMVTWVMAASIVDAHERAMVQNELLREALRRHTMDWGECDNLPNCGCSHATALHLLLSPVAGGEGGSEDGRAAEARNRIANVVEEVMGEPVNSEVGAPPRGPWLPLSVRYAAADAAARVVVAWREKGVTPTVMGVPRDPTVDAQLDADLRAVRAAEGGEGDHGE